MSRTGTGGPVVAAARREVRAVVRAALDIGGGAAAARAHEMNNVPSTLFNWQAGIRDPTAVDLARLAAACGLRLHLLLELAPPAQQHPATAEPPPTALAAVLVAARQRLARP